MMRLTRLGAGLVMLLPGPVVTATAQQVAPLGVRHWSQPMSVGSGDASALTGNATELDPDTIVLASAPATCAQVATRVRCALGFGVIGALLGAVVGYVATTCTGCESSGFGAVAGVAYGFVGGVVVGAFLCRPRWTVQAAPGGAGARR